jgi:hypothetical protein
MPDDTDRFDPTWAGGDPPAEPPAEPPTERMPVAGVPAASNAAPPAVPPPGPPPTDGSGRSRALLFWLIGVGAALLVAVVVVLVLLLGRNDDQPAVAPTGTASATPSETPSGTPSAPPSETPSATPGSTPTSTAQPGPTFDSFAAPTSAECEDGDDDAPLEFSWSSADAVRAFIGVGTTDAAANPTESNLPPVFTYSGLDYPCDLESQVYTVTLENAAGEQTSETVTITRR